MVQRDPFFVAGPGSYVDELLDILGWDNAVEGLKARWPQLSAEGLLQFAPDVILDLGIGSEETPQEAVAYWQRFPSLPAVRDGRVRALRSQLLVRPGPALRETFAELTRSFVSFFEFIRW